jgi:uncharacterized membrane protein
MDEQSMHEVPPPTPGGTAWTQTPPPPPPAAAADGLSDTAAGTLAYVTIIPAIIFLVMPPYNTRPFVKFHAFQCLGLAVVWFCIGIINIIPILGQIVFILGSLCMLVLWILCIVKASRGSAQTLPFISDFAAKQAGYRP